MKTPQLLVLFASIELLCGCASHSPALFSPEEVKEIVSGPPRLEENGDVQNIPRTRKETAQREKAHAQLAEEARLAAPNMEPRSIERRRAYLLSHPTTDQEMKETIAAGRLALGMSLPEVRASIGDVIHFLRYDRKTEVYKSTEDLEGMYLYLRDGSLLRWTTALGE